MGRVMSEKETANLIANYDKPGPARQHSIDAAAGRGSYTGRGKGWTYGNRFGETMTDPAFRARVRAAAGTPGGLPQPSGVPITGPGGTLAEQDAATAATGATSTALTPPMPPWLRALTFGYQQRYPGANLAGLPPIPSAQYMRNTSPSVMEGLTGTVQTAGGYTPDWLALIQYLAPKGAEFGRPTRNVFA